MRQTVVGQHFCRGIRECLRGNGLLPYSSRHCPLGTTSMNLDDTIVAIATPPGRGGIGVVRLAGPESRAIADGMLRKSRKLEPGRAILCDLVEGLVEPADAAVGASPVQTQPSSARIDEVVVALLRQAPFLHHG